MLKQYPQQKTPTKLTLSKLLAHFTTNPKMQYHLTCVQESIHTIITHKMYTPYCHIQDNSQISQCSQNVEHVHQTNCVYWKGFGLFANLIKQLEINKIHKLISQAKSRKPIKKYNFYFNNLNSNYNTLCLQNNNIESINQNEQKFNEIHGNVKFIDQGNRICLKGVKRLINQPQQSNTTKQIKITQIPFHNIQTQIQPLIDLDFSFDEISKHIQAIKQAKQGHNKQNLHKNIIEQTLPIQNKQNINNDKKQIQNDEIQDLRINQTKQRIKQLCEIAALTFSKNEQHVQTNILLQCTTIPKIQEQPLKSKESQLVKNVKQVQSRLYMQTPKYRQSQMRIDFDLDLNFF